MSRAFGHHGHVGPSSVVNPAAWADITIQLIFMEAAGYWESLLKDEGLIAKDAALPPKVIPANQ